MDQADSTDWTVCFVLDNMRPWSAKTRIVCSAGCSLCITECSNFHCSLCNSSRLRFPSVSVFMPGWPSHDDQYSQVGKPSVVSWRTTYPATSYNFLEMYPSIFSRFFKCIFAFKVACFQNLWVSTFFKTCHLKARNPIAAEEYIFLYSCYETPISTTNDSILLLLILFVRKLSLLSP